LIFINSKKVDFLNFKNVTIYEYLFFAKYCEKQKEKEIFLTPNPSPSAGWRGAGVRPE
jgi:hypothetical protein